MLKVGLTGGIGSGKSTVAGIFKALGIPVFNADLEAKKIMENDDELMHAIKKTFGDHLYPSGKLDRASLPAVVFSDPLKLEQLNALVHPVTITAARNWADMQTTKYIIKEAALLFEAGTAADLDIIIGVYAPEYLRINRVIKRDKSTRGAVLKRMDKQIDDTIKMRLCNFVITNDGQQLLTPQVIALHEKLQQL